MHGQCPCLELKLVLSCENLLVGEVTILIYRQKSKMHMRIHFVQVNDESCNVFLTPSVTDEVVHILRPLFNVLATFQVRIISTFCQVYFLVTESYFKHSLTASSKDEIHHCSEPWFFKSLIWILDTTSCKICCDSLWDAPGLIDWLYFASFGYLEIQMLTSQIIVAYGKSMFQCLV